MILCVFILYNTVFLTLIHYPYSIVDNVSIYLPKTKFKCGFNHVWKTDKITFNMIMDNDKTLMIILYLLIVD